MDCSIVSERLKNLFDSARIDNIQHSKTYITEKKNSSRTE
ncbi:hypothetical protein CLU83_1913 [Flavobacterium sp. 1]|nr:hypothetical protein CLU83_1913 [Flavobacterium sp. 1]